MSTDTGKHENIFLFVPNLIGKLRFSYLNRRVTDYNFVLHCTNRKTALQYFPSFIVSCFFCCCWFSGYGRIVLAVIAFYFMQTNYVVAGWCYIISALLDSVDGHAARAFNQSEYISVIKFS